MQGLSCCFIGHRTVANKEEVRKKVIKEVEKLIVEQGVTVFHFGSKSQFDDLCHQVVAELQERYPYLKRIQYRTKSEYTVKQAEKATLEERYRTVAHKAVALKAFEGERISDRILRAGKASYVERNQEMIDESTYCMFFYRVDYPQTPSGTKLAYEYAVENGKKIIHITNEV